MSRRFTFAWVFLIIGFAATGASGAEPVVAKYLYAGDTAGAIKAAEAALKADAKDDEARFGLAVAQFLGAIEHQAQAYYKFGVKAPDGARALGPLIPVAIPTNPNPREISYDDFRVIFQALGDDLKAAEATLAAVKSDSLKLRLKFGLIKLDLDGDGKASDGETFWRIFYGFGGQATGAGTPPEVNQFEIAFDAGDVYWLRGYCHFLMAMTDVVLAYDEKDAFERCAHLVFARPKTPHDYLASEKPGEGFDFKSIADAIALVHTFNFEVKEPKRMASALEHLHGMIAASRRSWELIKAENDDDHEWIPNKGQTGVIPNVRMTEDMIKAWEAFLSEGDDILSGKKLVPFWREAGGKGVNFKRVFTEPRKLDLVLWVQGTAATPYLEEGEPTDPRVWQTLERVFQGNFIGFAVWFN